MEARRCGMARQFEVDTVEASEILDSRGRPTLEVSVRPPRGERVAKYDRLLRIEHENPDLAFGIGRG